MTSTLEPPAAQPEAILDIWVVYDHPADSPHTFVARRHETFAGGTRPTHDVVICENLEPIRESLLERGLTRLERDPADPPVILETWI